MGNTFGNRFEQFIKEKQYLANVTPATVGLVPLQPWLA